MWDKIFEAISRKNPAKPISSLADLTESERATFKQWETILTRNETTTSDLKTLVSAELDRADEELQKYENTPQKDLYLKAYRKILKLLLTAHSAPGAQRDQLKRQIFQMYGVEL
jgi:hypothetical protein